ncbi:MAG TPA: hypothetical protein VGM70_08890 [Pseudolysinimonas sp.]|jgi:hypothetical protein
MSTPTIDLGASLSDAADAVTAQVSGALPVALPIGGAILAIGIGWRLFKRFAKG